jgi:hypothetical protein
MLVSGSAGRVFSALGSNAARFPVSSSRLGRALREMPDPTYAPNSEAKNAEILGKIGLKKF